MKLEIYAESDTLIVDETDPIHREMYIGPWGFRYFWRESLTDVAARSLPHAHVEIHSVTVSERNAK